MYLGLVDGSYLCTTALSAACSGDWLARCGGEQFREGHVKPKLRREQLTVRGDDVDLGVSAGLGFAVRDGASTLEVESPTTGIPAWA